MLEIAIQGQGEVAVALVDRKGYVLLRKRLVISGFDRVEAKTHLPLELATHRGVIQVIPILVHKSDRLGQITFDGRDPSAYADERCRQLKAGSGLVQKVIDADPRHEARHLRMPASSPARAKRGSSRRR
jgi:hypothetical protein